MKYYQGQGESKVKGRTKCPKCNKEFVLDLPKGDKTHKITCPKCKHEYTVKAKCDTKLSDKECSWEEHGEPRKTVLSSLRPESKRPFIAVILLICVFSIGITTAVFADAFITSTTDTASFLGLNGSINAQVTNQTNASLEDMTISVNGEVLEYNNGTYRLENAKPGLKTIELAKNGYKTVEKEILVMPVLSTEIGVLMEKGTESLDKIYFDTIGCTTILLIFSVFALVAMISCLKRQHLDLAIGGSFLAIFSFGFFFIGSILSIVAFILIMLSRDEFENGKKGKVF